MFFCRRKIFAFTSLAVFLLLLLPRPALADNHDVTAGQFNLSTCAAGDTVTIAPGATVELIGSATNTAVICGAGVTLTINGVSISNYSTGTYTSAYGVCPISFSGSGNRLVIKGTNTIVAGHKQAGVSVTGSASLDISGDGALNVTGGTTGGAGIGGGWDQSAGTISIYGGVINATGGENGSGGITPDGAGIGGGANAGGGVIKIYDGTVKATGEAGIGGGYRCTEFDVSIYGGDVEAVSVDDGGMGIGFNSEYGAGIGSGSFGTGTGAIAIYGGNVKASGGFNAAGILGGYHYYGSASLLISGGTVSATGGRGSAGIGTGYNTPATLDIEISGGVVYACRGYSVSYDSGRVDIGYGAASPTNTIDLEISDTAAVFLESNTCVFPSCPDGHVNKTPADSFNKFEFDSSNTVYGITVDSSWIGADGGYFRLANLYYDANGGSGSVPPSAAQHVSTTATVAGGGALSNGEYVFDGWNTLANGEGRAYTAGDTLTFSEDITLFAQWKEEATPTPVPSADIPATGDGANLPELLFAVAGATTVIAVLAAVLVLRSFRKSKEEPPG